MLYNGQLDVIVGAPLTENFLAILPWSKSKQYISAQRRVWKVNEDLAGYIRAVDKFYQVFILTVF